MKLINLIWRERGYLRQTFWATAEVAAFDAAACARRMVARARRNAGVFNVRVKIAIHPTANGQEVAS